MVNCSGGGADALDKGRWKRGTQRKSTGDPKKAGHFCPAITETQSIFLPCPGPSIRLSNHFRLG